MRKCACGQPAIVHMVSGYTEASACGVCSGQAVEKTIEQLKGNQHDPRRNQRPTSRGSQADRPA